MYLGIEIGGTKLQVAAGTQGQLVETLRAEIETSAGAEGIRQQLSQMIPELQSRHEILGIGIGFGGPLDANAGIITTSHQIEGWDKFPLAQWCIDSFGTPCRVINDCDAAALAEATWGAGRGFKTVLYITVGTGVGGGLVIDGQLHGQDRPAVAEIGHLHPNSDTSSTIETVEAYASGRGIETRLVEKLNRDPEGTEVLELNLLRTKGSGKLTARQIFETAAEGNTLAIAVIDRACRMLGWGIAQAITLIAPDIVAIGGGVSLAGEELFFAPVRAAVEENVFAPLRESYQIVPASLGKEVVLYGAIAIAQTAKN